MGSQHSVGAMSKGPWDQPAWSQISSLPPMSYVNLGKLLNLSMPQFPHI